MKIRRAVVHPLCLPLPRPLRTAIHEIRTVDTVLVELQGDGGAVGVGYCFAFGERRARALQALVEDLAPIYEGGEAAAARALFDRAWASINFVGHAGVAVMALAALDTACWDLAARAAGLPLWRLLGGDRSRVPTYASSGLWLDRSLDELVAEARGFVAAGHRAMKMRLGKSTAEDLTRARALREALGPDIHLMADVNQGWDEATAIRTGRALEAIGLYWLEEPLPYEDLEGAARVAAALDTPIASGETEYGWLGMKRYLDARAADILMPDLQRMGGVSGYLKAVALCEAYQRPVSSHLFVEVSGHVLAAAPHGVMLEYMDWWQPLFEERLPVVDGHVILSERPGLGVTLDRKALARLAA
ncbi:MAG TPA: mandelate racemase/muconate lactonizing enzyme family protein [Methylomirabilota bacterium]|nr:mandelate racemase/muconate lactonizing enzyme family protein [Methylomirabilota bacterium]